MFYQVNVCAYEIEELRRYQLVREEHAAPGPFGIVHIISAVEPLLGNDDLYKSLENQAALVEMRSVLLRVFQEILKPFVPRPYYLIARYFQQPYGWSTLTEYERETISPMLEALLKGGNLTEVVPAGAPGLPLLVTTPEFLMAHITDLPLVARLAATHLILKHIISLAPHLMSLENVRMEHLRDWCRFCSHTFRNLKRCARCKVTFYCSSGCQAMDWKQSHKEECPELVRIIADAISRAEAASKAKV